MAVSGRDHPLRSSREGRAGPAGDGPPDRTGAPEAAHAWEWQVSAHYGAQMTDPAEWLNQLPEAMRSGLVGIVKAAGGMSKAEKAITANWCRHIYEDETAPPAVRAYAEASYIFLGASIIVTDPDTTGHVDRAAKKEEWTRLINRVVRPDRGDESPPS